MKILVWASTFGADLWSFTHYLDRQPGIELQVIMDDPATFRRQAIARHFPLKAKLIARHWYHHYLGAHRFQPDVVILDNWLPKRALAPKALMLWHGFGWGAGSDASGFSGLHRDLCRTWGDARVPNPNFLWQCFGPTDFNYRVHQSGFAQENCRILGAASHDDLFAPFDRQRVVDDYPFDILGRQTILIAPTWTYGEVFGQWGNELDIFDRLLKFTAQRHVNVILRMHDSYRYEKKHRLTLRRLNEKHPHMLLKYKDSAPDNLLDLQVSDVLITNFSSIANLYYATMRPSIHILPASSPDANLVWRRFGKASGLRRQVGSIRKSWKMPPEENGGLLATTFEELLQQIDQSLSDPNCCKARSEMFLKRHMVMPDGRICMRIFEVMSELVRR